MEEEDYSKLSIEERCVHKVWKARVSGYESAANHFRQIDDEKSSEWNKYIALIKKFIVDSNVNAQEKGLEATLAFVENCATAGKTVNDVINGLIQKCVGAPKARTKELATQIILMYIEIEKQDIVLEELIKGTENKYPKISAACIHIITLSLQEFGAKVINVSKILKRIQTLLEDRDKTVREEAKTLIVEIFRWMGPTLKAQLTNLKATQLTEIETEYEKLKDKPLRPTRLLKSQQSKKLRGGVDGMDQPDAGCEADAGLNVAEVDPYEFLDPIDILSQLPKNFYTQLEAKKWSERKEALDVLEKLLAAAPKIENADYSELVKTLKKIIQKDSNVVVVGVAIKCIGGLAIGLKKKFHQYSSAMMPCLFEKFKEKKQNVVLPLRDAVDAVYLTTNLELILEDVITFLDNKNPNVKAEIVFFLTRCFAKSTPTTLNKKLLKPLTKALLKTLIDQDQVVRDNAAQALGTAMKVTGEKTISPFLTEVDNQKLAKIKECCEKAEVVVQPRKVAEPKAADPQTTKKSQDKVVVPKANASKLAAQQNAKVLKNVGNVLPKDEVMKQLSIIPDDIKNLISASGADQISGYESLKEFVEQQEPTQLFGQTILTFLYLDDIIKSTDTSASSSRINVIKTLVENAAVGDDMLDDIILEAGNSLSIKSSKSHASSALNILAASYTLDRISKQLLSRDFEDTPTLWADTLNWISNAIMKDTGTVDADFLMDCGKKALSQTDALVRNAGLALIGTAHLQVKDDNNSKPTKTAPIAKPSIAQESTKSTVETYVQPTSTIEKEKPAKDDTSKCDLSPQITEQLLGELADKNWKVRAEAVTKLHTIVRGAGNIGPNLGEAPPILAARIADSNSKIAVASIQLIESLAAAMGQPCKQHTRIFLPALIKLIGDPKMWIRTAVKACLNTWYETGGYKEFFEGEIMAESLRSGSPSLRSELWNFLAQKLPNIPQRSIPKDELTACLPTLYSNIEDRNADVRKNACEAVLGFMTHLGFNTMNSACDNIKGSGGAQVKILLEKTRGSVPEALPPPNKTRMSVASSSSRQNLTSKMVPGSSATITIKSVKTKGNVKQIASSKKEEEVETGALLQINNLKNQRIIDDQKLKTLKWNFTTPRPEFVELLKELMSIANVNKQLIANMFHSDFRYHLRAIDSLIEDLASEDLTPLISNLDLILRWMTLRFFDTNPSVLLKGLDYLNRAFQLLIEGGYQMLDYEAYSFIPYLILKVGDPKDTVRNSIRAIFKQISNMFSVTKLFTFIMEGIKSKNARQRSECLEQLTWLIENYGVVVCQPNLPAALKEIAKCIADRDTTVRNAALNCVVTAYFLCGERVMKMVGPIADKDMTLLEERIKRASKNRPVASVKPLQTIAPTPVEVEVPQNRQRVDYNHQEENEEHDNSGGTYPRSSSSDEYMSQGNNSTFNVENDTFTLLSQQGQQEHNSGSVGSDHHHHLLHHQNHRSPPQQNTLANGPFLLDQRLIDNIENESVNVSRSRIGEVDLDFLKDPVVMPPFQPMHMATMTPTLSNYTQKNTLKWEITQIASSDLEKAIESVSQIDKVLTSDKRNNLEGFIDVMVTHLVHQLIILNQSSLPDVVTCYRANFSLLMKLTNYPELCAEITENTIFKLLDRLISLLVERRLQGLDRHEMFVRTINTLVLRCMDQCNKTNVLCTLIHLLYDTVSNPSASYLYKDLVAKCLWKFNRTQPEWDSHLDYTRVLTRINIFFRDYPSAWWKTQENDVPLRTVKTILHTMVKLRGVQVQEIAKTVPELSQDSELYIYIKKLVRHLSNTNTSDSHQSNKDTSGHGSTGGNDSTNTLVQQPPSQQQPQPPPKLTKETRDQLSEIFKMIGDPEETTEGMKKLFLFKKTHPEADITPFLSKATPVFQQFIERGLGALEQQQNTTTTPDHPQQTIHKKNQMNNLIVGQQQHHDKEKHELTNINMAAALNNEDDNNSSDGIGGKTFQKESEKVWSRLQYLKEQAGLPVDARTLDDFCGLPQKECNKIDNHPTRQTENLPIGRSMQSIKESFQIIKANLE